MLTKEQYRDIEQIIETRYSTIEAQLIKMIASSVAHGKASSNVNVWRIQKLAQMGKLEKAVKQIVDKQGESARAEITKAILEAIKQSSASDAEVFAEAAEAGELSKVTAKLVGTSGKMFERFERSVLLNVEKALNLTNTRAEQIAKTAYRNAINSAFIDVRAGVTELPKAISRACHDLGGSGLRVTYRDKTSGRLTQTYSLDASIRRDIVTSLTQSTAKFVLEQNEEAGNDYVQVSTLADSRPSHAPFQGNVYCVSGKDHRYPPLSSTGYGTAGGLCGINCRHRLMPYFPVLEGRAKKVTMTKEEKEANERRYKISQEQRYYERSIRFWTRQLVADEAGGDAEQIALTKSKLEKAQQRMEKFIASTGRTRRTNREQV